jgi:hypothetical protein
MDHTFDPRLVAVGNELPRDFAWSIRYKNMWDKILLEHIKC